MSQLERLQHGLRELRRNDAVELHERVDLRAWTALGVGGLASLVVRCHNDDAVRQTLELAASHGLGWLVLGGGSRVVPPNHGVRVPVISLTGELGRWELELDGLVAGAGANLAQLCRAASRHRLSGLQHLGDTSHSVGGLVTAASHRLIRIDGLVEGVELTRPGGGSVWWCPEDSRPVPGRRELRRRVITRVRFRLRPARPSLDAARLATATVRGARRIAKPVFLDTPDASAADLLAEAGMSSAVVGGVRLGGGDGNQLVAGRSASSTDVLDLCRRARDRVAAATGVVLTPAMVFVDEDGREIEL
jgi:UDP-N-acetylmuramate dehydrogenase